jgi:flagellar hook assembly protein FlgD
LISLGVARIVSPVRIPRLLMVPTFAFSMLCFAGPASAATAVTVDGTSGTLTFHASSSASYVQFFVDGTAVGTPVATSGGSAATTFDSWGYANSDHQVGAGDCPDTTTCESTPSATVGVTLTNAAPTITAPAADTHVLGGFHVTATTDGGGLRFSLHGSPFDFVAAPPYDGHYQGAALSPGTHTVKVTQCDATGSVCEGPADTVGVVADSLQPRITALAPNPFSPKHGRTTLGYTVQDREDVSVTVRDAAGDAVRGPLDLGTRSGGAHSWSWSGNTNAGPVAPSGRYRIVLATSREADGVTVHGRTTRVVTLDSTAPVLAHVTGPPTFYPVRDRYRDTFAATTRLSETALVTLHVNTAGGRAVRTVEATRKRGRATVTWDGRNGAGRIVPAGTYRWYSTARDAAGNTARSAVSTVTASSSRLVGHGLSLVHNGADAHSTNVTDRSCGEASRKNSDYPNGLWLVNGCYQSTSAETVAATFRFVVPRATRYDRLATTVDGYSLFAPSRVHAAYRSAATGKWDAGALVTIRTSRQGLHALGTQTGAQHVGPGHVVTVSVVVDNADAPCDLDISRVLVRLRYSVLTP